MTVLASDLDGRADFAVELCVSVNVLIEVTIDTVHATFEMDVHQMNRRVGSLLARLLLLFCRRTNGGFQLGGGRLIDGFATIVKQVALTILLEDCAKHPAVPMKIGELRMARLRIEIAHVR